VSRQRYFGVPIPLWYRLDGDGQPDYDDPIVPESLPVDPITEVPAGYTEEQRDVPGGFTADPDVLDTWATSSLTPQLLGGWSREIGRASCRERLAVAVTAAARAARVAGRQR